MVRGRRLVALATLIGMLALTVVNVVAPPVPEGEEEPDPHRQAIEFQESRDIVDIAMAHGSSRINHYYGFFLTLERYGGGGTITKHPDIYGNAQDFLGFSRMTLREDDGYDHELTAEEHERLRDRPHLEGEFIDTRPPTEADFVIVESSADDGRAGRWRAMTHEETVVWAPEPELRDAGVEW